jgi:hypothetical protein
VLRAALILTLVLVMPASADLWTAVPGADQRETAPPPRPSRMSAAGGAPPSAGSDWTLIAVVDPACPVTAALAQDLVGFAREHRDVAVQVRLTARPGGSRAASRALAALAEAGVRVSWSPAAVRDRRFSALPALSLHDAHGRGARATGRPPLDVLWRAATEAAR